MAAHLEIKPATSLVNYIGRKLTYHLEDPVLGQTGNLPEVWKVRRAHKGDERLILAELEARQDLLHLLRKHANEDDVRRVDDVLVVVAHGNAGRVGLFQLGGVGLRAARYRDRPDDAGPGVVI